MAKFMDENSVSILWGKIKENFVNKIDATSTYLTKEENEDNLNNINTFLNTKANNSDLATVATSGNYNDLINKPNIPNASEIANKTYVTESINNLQDDINTNIQELENDIATKNKIVVLDLLNDYGYNQFGINNFTENNEESEQNLVLDIFTEIENGNSVILKYENNQWMINQVFTSSKIVNDENQYIKNIICSIIDIQISEFNYDNESKIYLLYACISYNTSTNTTQFIFNCKGWNEFAALISPIFSGTPKAPDIGMYSYDENEQIQYDIFGNPIYTSSQIVTLNYLNSQLNNKISNYTDSFYMVKGNKTYLINIDNNGNLKATLQS